MAKKEQAPLDVYASPYVPLKLKQLNDAAAHIVPSKPAPWINYQEYVNSFAGSSFLPSREIQQNGAAERGAAEPDLLESSTYRAIFTAALQQEESALRKEYDAQSIYQATLTQTPYDVEQSMYRLVMPGLRELTLPLEIGDIVRLKQMRFDQYGNLITFTGSETPEGPLPGAFDICHEAVVWIIDRKNEILFLRIDGLHPMSMLFNACFTVQSGRLNSTHRALREAQIMLQKDDSWLRAMLFPETHDGAMQRKLNAVDFKFDQYDEQLNHEQLRAISTVLNEDYGRMPYLMSGPPGTGKTKTIVELALQLVAADKTSRILLCAPSDPAADTIVNRLSKQLSPKEVLRMNSPARSFPEVPDAILPFCHVEDRFFSLPEFSELMRKRIVVVTVRDAEILREARITNCDLFSLERGMNDALHPEDTSYVPTLHWSALLMDEAAQATEPEALLPLLAIAPPDDAPVTLRQPLVVMVGDENQLGPRTASKKAVIQTSLFERLLSRPTYSDHPLARRQQKGGHVPRLTKDMLPIIRPPFTDLIRNYRSHPAILATPSSLFYNDTLEPCAANTESLLPWYGFKGRQMPVLFRDNRSPDEIEQDGGGWYNLGEADVAIALAQSFLRQDLLRPSEICIMSPFRAQVKILRTRARAQSLSAINIGPLEAYQGLESRLVIVCTTRTRSRFIDEDITRGLGVIHEPRRFNVALTRAKEGVIVIGNPDVLDEDQNWASFLAFCKRNGAWEGELSWHIPHSNKIRHSRLEKQLQMRNAMGMADDNLVNGARKLGTGTDGDEAAWTAGIAAEEAVRRNDNHA